MSEGEYVRAAEEKKGGYIHLHLFLEEFLSILVQGL